MYEIVYKLAIIALIANSSNCLNLCGDWTQYKDIKCIKVLEKKATQEEAQTNCTNLGQTSTLLTIHSKDEQDFLNNLLAKYNKDAKNIWIGMKYTDKSYQWTDGTVVNFTNWAEDAVRDGIDPCVQMSLVSDSLGKWTDMSCKKPAMIVCQKKQELNLNSLKDIIESQSNIIEKLSKTVEVIEKTTVPIGFLYTQLPNQSSPLQLWPNMKWTEVTKQYSGLFFRAEGSGSESFGKIQPANQSSISHANPIACSSREMKAWSVPSWECEGSIVELKEKQWGGQALLGPYAIHQLLFYKSSGEVRPTNTAIKIWKRI